MATIKATKRDADKVVEVEYDMPETVEALVEKFGEDAVASAAADSFTISIQALIRRHIDKEQNEIEELVQNWRPGVRQPGVKKSPLEKAKAALSQMSAEDRAALLAQLGG